MVRIKNILFSPGFIAVTLFAALVFIVPLVQGESRLDTDATVGNVATSSPEYIQATGANNTSTTTIDTLGVDHVDMNLQLTASTTATALHWKYEFSHDNIDWFGEDLAQTASAGQISHSTSTIDHLWEPNNETASTTPKNVGIPVVSSRYMRAIFSVTGGNGAVWAQFTRKKN